MGIMLAALSAGTVDAAINSEMVATAGPEVDFETTTMQKTEFAGVAFAGPGSGDITFVDLDPGKYAVVCFIPVGTTDMADLEAGEGDQAEPAGPPHFTQGMVTEFTVES